jgi:hypothetical protein
MATANAFCRELLPPALDFYQRELGVLGRPNRQGWCACRCPFHHSKSGKSFAVHIDGAFVCRSGACGVRGGDLVSFVQLRDNCNFRTACQNLGAWRDITEAERRKFDEQAAARARERDLASEAKARERARCIAIRDEIHLLVEIQSDVSSRLSELLKGGAPAYDNEVEDCWSVLSLALDDMRLTESEYLRTCGLIEVSA